MPRPRKTQAEVMEGPKAGDGVSQLKALEAYKEVAADYAKKAQVWKDAQEARDVRMSDLVKVHAHRPFDDKSAARVAKREAKQALDSAWATVASFEDWTPVRPLIPDDEEEDDEDDA